MQKLQGAFRERGKQEYAEKIFRRRIKKQTKLYLHEFSTRGKLPNLSTSLTCYIYWIYIDDSQFMRLESMIGVRENNQSIDDLSISNE